jgi:hypothetical protein
MFPIANELIFPKARMGHRNFNFSTYSPMLAKHLFKMIIVILTGMKRYLNITLICTLKMALNIKNHFICFLALCRSYLEIFQEFKKTALNF